jgi:hypothetical protein
VSCFLTFFSSRLIAASIFMGPPKRVYHFASLLISLA